MTNHTPKRRGFPIGTPRNRLTPQQRQAIIDMLKVTPNGAAVTRQFVQAKLGTVTHPTVCTIKREAVKQGAPTNQIGRQIRQSIVLALRPAVFDGDVLAVEITHFVEALPEGRQSARNVVGLGRPGAEIADHRHRLLQTASWLGRRGALFERCPFPNSLPPLHLR